MCRSLTFSILARGPKGKEGENRDRKIERSLASASHLDTVIYITPPEEHWQMTKASFFRSSGSLNVKPHYVDNQFPTDRYRFRCFRIANHSAAKFIIRLSKYYWQARVRRVDLDLSFPSLSFLPQVHRYQVESDL